MYVCVNNNCFFSYFGEAKMDMKWRNIGPNHQQKNGKSRFWVSSFSSSFFLCYIGWVRKKPDEKPDAKELTKGNIGKYLYRNEISILEIKKQWLWNDTYYFMFCVVRTIFQEWTLALSEHSLLSILHHKL